MKIRAVHIDDEPLALQNLQMIVDASFPELEIIGTATRPFPAIKLINEMKPDLVFLDISLPGGSGFDILEAVSIIDFEVIFVTAFENYAIQAIKKSALDYILKPIDEEELNEAIEKYKEKVLGDDPGERTKLFVNTKSSVEVVLQNEIIHIEAFNSYSTIHMLNGDQLVVSKNLSNLEKVLNVNFVRVHKSYIVNMQKVRRIMSDESVLVLINSCEIPVSRRKKKDVLALLGHD